MARKRRVYTPEFKAEAVKLVTDKGYSVAEAPSEEEMQRLRAENQRLRAERDILKKATALFAREAL